MEKVITKEQEYLDKLVRRKNKSYKHPNWCL